MASREELLQRALLETSLKLGPQASALRSLLSQAAGGYSRTRRVNASNAAGIAEATRQARPAVAGAFDQALASSQAQRAALGVAGTEPQAAAYERRVAEQKANAVADLVQRESRAMEGKVFANQQAREEYLGNKQKIVGELQGLARQSGDLTAATLGSLEDREADRSLRARGQDITVRGQDIASRDRRAAATQRAQDKAAAAKKAKGPKLASQEQHAAARDAISRGVSAVEDLKQDTQSRAEIIKLLIAGVPAVRKDGVELAPAIKPMSADYARAAVNMAFDGSLSRGDVKRLHNRRLKLRALGYPIRPAGRGAKQGMVDALSGLAGSVPRVQG